MLGFLGLIFLLGVVAGPMRVLLPVYVESELGRSPSFSSGLLLLMLASSGLFAVLGGALTGRLGQKWALVLGMLAMPIMALLYLNQGQEPLMLLALAAGLIEGLQIVGGQSYLVAGTPPAHLGLASALFFLGHTLGSALGSLGAGTVVESMGFTSFGIVAFVAAVVLVVCAARLLPEVRIAKQQPSVSPRQMLCTYCRLCRHREFFLVMGLRFLPTWYWGVAMLLMPLLLFRLSDSVLAVSIFNAASLAVAAACQLLTGRVSDRIGRGWPVLVLAVLYPVVITASALSVRSFHALFTVGIIATAVAWSMSVNFPPLVREFTAEEEHGPALGFLHLLWVVGMLLGTVIGGALVDIEPALPFAIVAALNVPTALVGYTVWKKLRPHQPALETDTG